MNRNQFFSAVFSGIFFLSGVQYSFGMFLPPYDPPGKLYELLEIENNASNDQIKASFLKKALIFHPDKPNGNEVKFKAINAANTVLLNEEFRKKYDALRLRMQDQNEYVTDAEYKKMDESFRGFKEYMTDIRWEMPITWGNIKKAWSKEIVTGIALLPALLIYKIGEIIKDKIVHPKTHYQLDRENVQRKEVGLEFWQEDYDAQKELKKDLKDIWNKIIATQKSLVNDDLDENQREKLQSRLKKYTKQYKELAKELVDDRKESQQNFEYLIKNLQK